MAARCADVRLLCADLIVASSALYAPEEAAAGAGTVICEGPLSRIMRHDPALGSMLAGSRGGSAGNGETDLSHPFIAVAAATVTPTTTDLHANVRIAAPRLTVYSVH